MAGEYDKKVDAVRLDTGNKTDFSLTFDDIKNGLEEKRKRLSEYTSNALTGLISGTPNTAHYSGGIISFKSDDNSTTGGAMPF